MTDQTQAIRVAIDKELRDTGFTTSAREYPRDEEALRLLCAFVNVDPSLAPPGWWFHPNASNRDAWKRVAEVAKAMYQDRCE